MRKIYRGEINIFFKEYEVANNSTYRSSNDRWNAISMLNKYYKTMDKGETILEIGILTI